MDDTDFEYVLSALVLEHHFTQTMISFLAYLPRREESGEQTAVRAWFQRWAVNNSFTRRRTLGRDLAYYIEVRLKNSKPAQAAALVRSYASGEGLNWCANRTGRLPWMVDFVRSGVDVDKVTRSMYINEQDEREPGDARGVNVWIEVHVFTRGKSISRADAMQSPAAVGRRRSRERRTRKPPARGRCTPPAVSPQQRESQS
jgi:hypothetical protein